MAKYVTDSLLSISDSVTGAKNGTAIQIDNHNEVGINVRIKSRTGTSPTLDITFQGSVDGTTYVDVVKMPQLTAVGTYGGVTVDMTKYKFIRPVYAVGGTTPNFGIEIKFN